MSNICGLACQIIPNCAPVLIPGVNGEEIILVPFNDVDKSASTFNVDGEMTSLVLNVGASVFRWQGSIESVKMDIQGSVGEFIYGKWMHNATISGYGNEWQHKENYMALLNGIYIAFIRTKDQVIHVLGWDTGLRGLTATWNAVDSEGTWQITIGTNSNQFEPKTPRNFVGLLNAWSELQTLATSCPVTPP